MFVRFSSCVLQLSLAGIVYVLTQHATSIDAEMFTAVVELERAVMAERHIAEALKMFTQKEQDRLDVLKR